MFGEEIDFESRMSFYTDGNHKKPADGEVFKVQCEELTFDDFIFGGYIEDNGVSRVDWYNAAIEVLDTGINRYNTMSMYDFNLYNRLMQWYEYDVDFPAGAEVINTVTAPMFPSVDMSYAPSKYTFTYLLSPAAKWDSFADLDIVINTKSYVIEQSYFADLETVDGGYTMHFDNLPDDELIFTLCSSKNPDRVENVRGIALAVVFSIIGGSVLFGGAHFVATLIIFCVLLTKYKNRRQQQA